jgi:hypothetical protein
MRAGPPGAAGESEEPVGVSHGFVEDFSGGRLSDAGHAHSSSKPKESNFMTLEFSFTVRGC